MKKILMLLVLLGFAQLCFAGATAEIVGTQLDQRGNIAIWTRYTKDGAVVYSSYPQNIAGRMNCPTNMWDTNVNQCQAWVSGVYSATSFYAMTDVDKQARIDKDLQAYNEQLLKQPFQIEAANLTKDANATLYKTDFFKTIVGHTVSTTTVKMQVDTNFDGKADKEWTITNGLKTEAVYTPSVEVKP
jgi:hypothetical protein